MMPLFVVFRRQNKAPKNNSRKPANKVAKKITKKSAKANATEKKWRSPAKVARKRPAKNTREKEGQEVEALRRRNLVVFSLRL
jgi:hypothetical protein